MRCVTKGVTCLGLSTLTPHFVSVVANIFLASSSIWKGIPSLIDVPSMWRSVWRSPNTYPLYWITKFSQRGFHHDAALSSNWREAWRTAGDVALCYYQNLMIFAKHR